jgi:proline racemase
MGLVPFLKGREARSERVSEVIEVLTLDDLWRQAEDIGRVSVDKSWGGNAYKVKIKFERASGTTVWAAGEDMDIRRAVDAAIQEARLLGR